MGGGQHDLGVKADKRLHLRRKVPQRRAGQQDFLENFARQTELLYQRIVPILAFGPHQRRGAGVGVLVGGNAAQQVVEVVGDHQKGFGGGKLFGVLVFQRRQLIRRVEGLVLDARAGVVLGKGQPGGQCVAHALGALVAVGDGIAQTLAVFIQQHKVHGPGVNADGGGGVARVVGGFQAVEHLPR